MRRIASVGVLVGVGLLVVQARGAKWHERVMAHCAAMFERVPDTFPPKKMMRGIEEIRVTTSRILELLKVDNEKTDEVQVPEAASREVDHAA